MTWNIDPILFKLGFIEIRYYGMFFATGLFLAYYLFAKLAHEDGWKKDEPDKVFLYIVICLVLGAHFVHIIFYETNSIWKNPIRIVQLGMGLASHGGAAGAILGMWLFSRKYKKNFLGIADKVTAGVGITAAFIRFGNFFNSEIIGRPTDVSWAIIFKRIDSLPRHPSQLYEGFFLLLMFFITYPLYRKYRNKIPTGVTFFAFLAVYFSFRIFAEMFKRYQSEAMKTAKAAITMGQWLSIPVVVFSIVMLIILYRKKKS